MNAQLAAALTRRLPGMNSAAVRTLVRAVVFVVLLSIAYRIGMDLTGRVAHRPGALAFTALLTAWAGAFGAALAFRTYRYHEIWTPIRVLLQGTGLVFFVQCLFDAFHPASFVSNVFTGSYTDARVLIGLAILSGILAWRRPAFLLPLLLAYFMFRHRAPAAYGLPATTLDFTTPLDVGAFSILCLLAARAYDALQQSPFKRVMQSVRLPEDPQHSVGFKKVLWGLVVGMHLGNYFHSALAKIRVGGGDPLFWVSHNPTERAIAIGLHRFNNPLSQWPWAVDAAYATLHEYHLAFNVFVLGVQLFSPLSVLSRRSLALFTLCFDLLHLGIYGALGAFFFLWIALNLIILASVSRIEKDDYTWDIKITAMATAVIGYLSFSTAQLGWLDGAKVVREVFYARTTDGVLTPAPPAMFGLFAYQIGHGDLYVPDGHFKVRFGGNVDDRRDWEDADTCGPKVAREQFFAPSMEGVHRLVQDADRQLLQRPAVKQLGLFYAYPHHMPTNPTAFDAFNRLEMRKVASYLYVVESACLKVTGGRPVERIDKRSEFPINVQR